MTIDIQQLADRLHDAATWEAILRALQPADRATLAQWLGVGQTDHLATVLDDLIL